jgi:hypothetical protein
MNNPELESTLKKARLPEIPGESLEQFPRRVAAGIRRGRESWSSSFSLSGHRASVGDTLKRELQRLFPRPAWGIATVICILAAFAIGHWRGEIATKAAPANDSLTSAKLIRETLAMFPNRVRAIVEDERGLNLVLSATADVPTSQPLYVRISDGKHSSSIVTFSGQEIQIAGQKLTVLSDAQGGIILMGNDFAWSSREPSFAKSDLKIEAKNLGAMAM